MDTTQFLNNFCELSMKLDVYGCKLKIISVGLHNWLQNEFMNRKEYLLPTRDLDICGFTHQSN